MKSIIIEKYEEEILTLAPESSIEINEDSDVEEAEDFKPRGAIAFFVLLMIICAVIWYGVYYLALVRKQ